VSNSLFHVFSRTAVSAAAAVVLAAPALAQNTTAALGGQVTGSDGKPLAGATVSILHVESRTVSAATTDADGRFGARGLRVGGQASHEDEDGDERAQDDQHGPLDELHPRR
jgi:hypothetical protein